MILTLVRHSKTSPTGKIPIPLWGLSEQGIVSVKDFANKQIVKEIEVIYSSLQTKALETALYLAKPNAIPIKIHPGLTEISSFTREFFGSGKYEQNVDDFYSEKIKRIANGETYQRALARFKRAIGEIIKVEEKNNRQNIGFISHGNILAFFSAQFCDQTPRQLHDLIRMPDLAVLNWDNKKFIKFWGEKND
ncbi:histidine phosphatase family protein [Patescibacteria group bacterium]